jgi:ergothioneine biosynthesis protein EgtB
MEKNIAIPTSLIEQYKAIRLQTESLCSNLNPEDMVLQPITDVSPIKWHLGHTTWFFETFILQKYYPDYQVFHSSYNYLFNSYYESIGERILRSNRGNLSRPLVSEVLKYRKHVDQYLIELLTNTPIPEVLTFLELGLQHEQQHQELLVTDIKYILGHNPLFPAYIKNKKTKGKEGGYKKATYLEIPEGIYKTGYSGKSFCYDNELPVHKSYINGFKIMDRLVANREYLEFIKDGGYTDFRHWHMEGWEIIKSQHWEAPLYWILKSGQWMEYTTEGLKDLSMHAPVTHISYYEAAAFASWQGKRLLTEQEWEAAVDHLKIDSQNGNFLENGVFQPQPAHDTYQLFGDCWEWTNSSYLPYPGYRRAPGALGEYNGKFMINQMVLKGGSCVSPKAHIRASYRNFFHPDKRWQYTGIRLAEEI